MPREGSNNGDAIRPGGATTRTSTSTSCRCSSALATVSARGMGRARQVPRGLRRRPRNKGRGRTPTRSRDWLTAMPGASRIFEARDRRSSSRKRRRGPRGTTYAGSQRHGLDARGCRARTGHAVSATSMTRCHGLGALGCCAKAGRTGSATSMIHCHGLGVRGCRARATLVIHCHELGARGCRTRTGATATATFMIRCHGWSYEDEHRDVVELGICSTNSLFRSQIRSVDRCGRYRGAGGRLRCAGGGTTARVGRPDCSRSMRR